MAHAVLDLAQPMPFLTWRKAPTIAELSALAGRIASRVGRFLERQGLLERDAESASLSELCTDLR